MQNRNPTKLTNRLSFFFFFFIKLPSVLKPDFDLLGFNIGQKGAFSDQLLTAERRGFRTFWVNALQCLHLLRRVPYILPAAIQMPIYIVTTLMAIRHRHSHRHLIKVFDFLTGMRASLSLSHFPFGFFFSLSLTSSENPSFIKRNVS